MELRREALSRCTVLDEVRKNVLKHGETDDKTKCLCMQTEKDIHPKLEP